MSTAAATDGLLSIGEVLHSLRSDFPDITISKIRYLESEGLVEPSRTPSGYRKFSHADLERLRYVLRMQRDNYLPLKVIRDHLDALDRGLSPAPLSASDAAPRALVLADHVVDPDELAPEQAELRMSRKELLEATGISNDVLRELESFNLVSSIPGSSFYDSTALNITKIAAELAQYGYGPRHLRPFRLAADRELALMEQVVRPMARGHHPDSRSRAEEAAHNITALAVRLHVALVKAGIPETLGR